MRVWGELELFTIAFHAGDNWLAITITSYSYNYVITPIIVWYWNTTYLCMMVVSVSMPAI